MIMRSVMPFVLPVLFAVLGWAFIAFWVLLIEPRRDAEAKAGVLALLFISGLVAAGLTIRSL